MHILRRKTTARAAPVKLADGTVAKFIGVQVDVTRTTEGSCSAFADGTLLSNARVWVRMLNSRVLACATGSGVPLLVKYDSRINTSNAGRVGEVMQARTHDAKPTCLRLTLRLLAGHQLSTRRCSRDPAAFTCRP